MSLVNRRVKITKKSLSYYNLTGTILEHTAGKVLVKLDRSKRKVWLSQKSLTLLDDPVVQPPKSTTANTNTNTNIITILDTSGSMPQEIQEQVLKAATGPVFTFTTELLEHESGEAALKEKRVGGTGNISEFMREVIHRVNKDHKRYIGDKYAPIFNLVTDGASSDFMGVKPQSNPAQAAKTESANITALMRELRETKGRLRESLQKQKTLTGHLTDLTAQVAQLVAEVSESKGQAAIDELDKELAALK